MSMTHDADHTAVRINISRILELFNAGDITPSDAVADLTKFCHPELINSDGEGLDTYIARTLALLQVGEIEADRALRHLVDLATAKTVDAAHLPAALVL